MKKIREVTLQVHLSFSYSLKLGTCDVQVDVKHKLVDRRGDEADRRTIPKVFMVFRDIEAATEVLETEGRRTTPRPSGRGIRVTWHAL